MKKIKLKKVIIKNYIIQFIVITIIFYVISHIIISSFKSNYYNHIQRDSLNLAKSYSLRLSKAFEAKDIINELLEQKLKVAIRTTAFYEGTYSNTFLK